MSKYKEVPEWWYGIIFISQFVFAVVSLEIWHTQFPIYAFVVCLLIAFTYVIPIGMIQAITNQQVGLNVITELIVGYWLPGKPITMMLFKTYGYITMAQALTFASDMKLGHYMKVPPRNMFWGQVVATVMAGTVQLGVQAWMFTNIPDMCSPHQPDGFICPGTEVFGTASIIWGVIGPRLLYSKGQLFYALSFFFLIGAFLPVVPYYLTKKWPRSFWKYVNFPVIFSGTGAIPPATAINYIPWAIVGFIFQFVIRRRHFAWWAKYNYILSAGMDSGLALSIVVIFFCLQYPKNGQIGIDTVATWWGNTVYLNTADAASLPFLPLPDKGYFGPDSW
jgi:OPT family small oligopeptide transporter